MVYFSLTNMQQPAGELRTKPKGIPKKYTVMCI